MKRYVASYLVYDKSGYTHGITRGDANNSAEAYGFMKKQIRKSFPDAKVIHICNIVLVEDIMKDDPLDFHEFE